ncbi:hypothetical protein [Natrinema salifodinae]|uniref:Uncharacterized protein n=1 Tax=Natrinema salifodinae TaxID=1202768 RepID=A0A1I0PQL2_9EURY|nr:hypothetical protein [Natrinema salifodinae]SEW16581.1 hypothetical protein SAMN05216285_2818 [Natrinema salifodinae]
MQFRKLAIVAVALLVALSGCSALGGSQTGAQSNDTTEDDTEEPGTEDLGDDVDSNGATDSNTESTGTETDTDGGGDGGDDTADAEWHPPEEPNRPLEDKREDRIESVEFVDKEPAENGEGYSNFNLEVTANTSMENVDPPEHGDVIGEPYFFVKINEGEGERKIVERTGQVQMDENGTYNIDVRPAGIEEFGERSLTVEVFLMDEDKDWDDIYDAVGEDIHFNPETESETETETETETESASETDDADETESSDQ